MLSVSCKLLTIKWAGNPWTPSAGIATAFLQLGQTMTLGLDWLVSLLLALAHLSKHSSQNEWRQGSPRGFLKGSRQMPQCIKFWVIFSAKEVAILPLFCIAWKFGYGNLLMNFGHNCVFIDCKYDYEVERIGGRGYSYFETYGDVQHFRVSFFERNPKTWVPFFMKKSITMGLIFKILKILKKIAKKGYFFTKIPKHRYLFLEKLLLNMVIGPKLPGAHPWPIQIWEPPGSSTVLIGYNYAEVYTRWTWCFV